MKQSASVAALVCLGKCGLSSKRPCTTYSVEMFLYLYGHFGLVANIEEVLLTYCNLESLLRINYVNLY